jgi:acyl-CoA synthetase (NDP forming)
MSSSVETILAAARKEGRNFLLEYEAEEILSARGIPVAPGVLAGSAEEAAAAAEKMGFPVVIKVMSPQIIHKSDAGAVKVGIRDKAALLVARETILQNARRYAPAAEIKGVFVQKMVAAGREVIVGSSRDPQFGPVIMFGLGGIFVEVLKDVVFRVAPVSGEEAERMIREIKTIAILKGVRGEKAINFAALASVIERISRLMVDFPEIAELDANPVRVDETKAIVVDARIILSKQ